MSDVRLEWPREELVARIAQLEQELSDLQYQHTIQGELYMAMKEVAARASKKLLSRPRWPQGDEAVEQLARALFAEGWNPVAFPYEMGKWERMIQDDRDKWIKHAAALLQRLAQEASDE